MLTLPCSSCALYRSCLCEVSSSFYFDTVWRNDFFFLVLFCLDWETIYFLTFSLVFLLWKVLRSHYCDRFCKWNICRSDDGVDARFFLPSLEGVVSGPELIRSMRHRSPPSEFTQSRRGAHSQRHFERESQRRHKAAMGSRRPRARTAPGDDVEA